ncbi:MFS transporter [Chitinophaga silvatica]|uniref:MFS transporter n=1 Tax=Chitinophaga silvatica TaxID=2282649 RepID=A0A3E1Y4J2_9BACT|nr:MFS transporter [Chitinophaga silvatica]RFS19630.1 MFS transporter [Chitinophaga silvatica]
MFDKISLKEKIGYGFGDMASSMFWKLFGTYLLFFYTEIVGLAAAAVGTLFLVTRIWDTFFDPMVGIVADRTTSKWGKFRPYILFAAIPFGIVGILTFSVPPFTLQGNLIYAYITYSLMMMVYSLINVPYASLLGVLSDDAKERNTLASFRMAFAFIGSLLALASIEPLVHFFSKGHNPRFGWQVAVTIIAIVCSVLFLLCFAWVKERVKTSAQPSGSLKSDVQDLLKNKPWWILLGAGIATLVFNSLRDGATLYYFKYFIHQSVAIECGNIHLTWSTLYLVTGQLANIIGVILAAALGNLLGKKKIYLLAMFTATILSILFYWLNREQLALIFIFQFMISICAGIVFPLLWSMYADIADYSEWKNDRRATGLIFSSSSMSQKFGWTIGGSLTGWLLGAFGFKANLMQSDATINGIVLMMSFLPAIGAFIAAVLMGVYPLSETRINSIAAELQTKRK